MSRSEAGPRASKPSGMSDRPELARVAMSAVGMASSPARLRSTTVAGFSRTMTPAWRRPDRVVMFQVL
jgi:hypothetical protein